MDYATKLNTPEWRLKRTKILKRDKYKCTVCESKKKLEIHHTFYYANYPDPWLYSDNSLLTLCSVCHRNYHLHHEIEIKKAKEYKAKKSICKSGNKKKIRKAKDNPNKKKSLKELYKIWEPRMKGKHYKYIGLKIRD